MPVTKQYN